MEESSLFRNLIIYQETNQIIEAQNMLSKLDSENFESVLLFFQSSIFVSDKRLAKSFVRILLNIIRFRTKNLEFYSNLCKNLNFVYNSYGQILVKFLKDADFMTPSQFKFYRLCISNKLISEVDVVKQISVVLYFNASNSSTINQFIPLFVWFLPEIYQYNIELFNMFYQRLKNDNKFVASQLDMLKNDKWSIFDQFIENQYINLEDKSTKNSIEYCLKEDDIDNFQILTENKEKNSKCEISFFDFLFLPTQQPNYLQFSAANSSLNCFKFLFISESNPKQARIDNVSYSDLFKKNLKTIIPKQKEKEIEVIEIDSSSDSESKSENENKNEEEDDDIIFIDDSEGSEEEKSKKKENDSSSNQVIVISESSSNNSDNENEEKIENNEKENIIDQKEIKEKSSRYWMPPIHPSVLTAKADPDSTHYVIRKSIYEEYSNSMKLTNTSQCAVAGGNIEIVRLIYDSEFPFDETPHIAISCFHNSLAKWIIEVALSLGEEQENPDAVECDNLRIQKKYSNLLYYSIISGNLEMIKYIISNMPNDINGRQESLNYIPLHLAIKYHQTDILSFLLNMKSVDVNITDEVSEKTPFFCAVDQKSLEMVKLIANNPFFDFNKITCNTLKPIHYVALYGTSKIMNFFISLNGVDINDNVFYKIDNERKRIKEERKKQKKGNKKKKIKKSNDIDDGADFLFFLESNKSDNEKEDDEVEDDDEESDTSSSEDYEERCYYYDYKSDLYDFDSKNIFLSNKNSNKPIFYNIMNTPIVCSLIANNIDNFFILVNNESLDINAKSDQMPLQFCISRDMKQIFEYLLSSKNKTGIDIDIYDRCGITPLHYAVFKKKKWAINSLIEAGCDVTKTTQIEGDTVCHIAAFSNSLYSIEKFITKKSDSFFDANVQNCKKQTPLHYATIYGSTQIVSYLLTLPSIDINASDIDGNTALHHSIQNSQHYIFEELLSNHSIDVNAMNNDNETPLIFAFKFKNERIISKLLSLNGVINPNCVEKITGNTPLHLSIIMKSENFIRSLFKLHGTEIINKLNSGDSPKKFNYYLNSFQYEFDPEVNVNTQNLKGFTALHLAAQSQSDILVRVLLSSPKIELDIVDFALNRCPIHYAAVSTNGPWFGMKMFNPYMYDCSRFSNTIFSQLINRDPLTGNIQDSNGDTPFHISLNDTGFDGNLLKNTAQQLNKNGDEVVKLTLSNLKGENYLHLSAASGNRIVLEYMIKNHPELINERTNDVFNFFFFFFMEFFFIFFNNVPLHYATMNGRVEMVALLMINDGIDKFAVNNEGKTPLDMALHDMRSQFRKYFVCQ